MFFKSIHPGGKMLKGKCHDSDSACEHVPVRLIKKDWLLTNWVEKARIDKICGRAMAY